MTELKPCHDCNAAPGELHTNGCDTERCPLCGGQALQCLSSHRCPTCKTFFTTADCDSDDEGWPTVVTDDMRIPWSGEWPGVMECREFGWYSYFDPANRDRKTGDPWIRCSPDHPGASEDLNRLATRRDANWSRELKRWVLKPTP